MEASPYLQATPRPPNARFRAPSSAGSFGGCTTEAPRASLPSVTSCPGNNPPVCREHLAGRSDEPAGRVPSYPCHRSDPDSGHSSVVQPELVGIERGGKSPPAGRHAGDAQGQHAAYPAERLPRWPVAQFRGNWDRSCRVAHQNHGDPASRRGPRLRSGFDLPDADVRRRRRRRAADQERSPGHSRRKSGGLKVAQQNDLAGTLLGSEDLTGGRDGSAQLQPPRRDGQLIEQLRQRARVATPRDTIGGYEPQRIIRSCPSQHAPRRPKSTVPAGGIHLPCSRCSANYRGSTPVRSERDRRHPAAAQWARLPP